MISVYGGDTIYLGYLEPTDIIVRDNYFSVYNSDTIYMSYLEPTDIIFHEYLSIGDISNLLTLYFVLIISLFMIVTLLK